MKRIVALVVLMFGGYAFAQETTVINVKSSAAQDALVSMAKDSAEAQKAKDDLLAKARKALEDKNKPLIDQMKVKAKPSQDKIDAYTKIWQTKIETDTKDIRVVVEKNNKEAEENYKKQVAPLDPKILSPQTLKTLEDIVKKEQSLPADATFDSQKQVWVVPSKAATSPEAKK